MVTPRGGANLDVRESKGPGGRERIGVPLLPSGTSRMFCLFIFHSKAFPEVCSSNFVPTLLSSLSKYIAPSTTLNCGNEQPVRILSDDFMAPHILMM